MTSLSSFKRIVAPLCAALAALGTPTLHAQGTAIPAQVISAERLVRHLQLEDTSYEHGQGSVTWSGTVASHTDCSGFIDHLLMHNEGYSTNDFQHWFGNQRPTAARYHDAIVEGKGFIRLATVADLRPGDFIAIKYRTRSDNTGHIMLVTEPARKMQSTPPFVDGTAQWKVTVIDSSKTGHGPTDTRYKGGYAGADHEGLGRGVFRLYTMQAGKPVGFSWSVGNASHFIAPTDEHLVLGRLVADFRP